MFQHTGRLKATFGLLGLALAGCTTNPEVQDQGTGINLRSAIGNTCVNEGDAGITFDIEITGAGETTYGPVLLEDVALTQVFDAGDLDLGGDPDLTGIWVGGDRFIALPPGDYNVTATASGTSVALLPGNSQTHVVNVPEGQTAETTFAFQCEGQTLSALDVVVLVSEGPSIIGWEYGDDKFAMVCEDVSMTATFSDLQGGPLHVTYEVFAEPVDNYAGPGNGGDALVASAEFDGIAPVGGGDFPVTWTHAPEGPAGTYYVYVTGTNNAEPPQSTTFQALLHVYDAIGDYCAIDHSWTTEEYALVASGVNPLLTYLPPGSPPLTQPTIVDSATLTLDAASLEFYTDSSGAKHARIRPTPTAPVVNGLGQQIVGHQTFSYGGNEVEFRIAFNTGPGSPPVEMHYDAAADNYYYLGAIKYDLFNSSGTVQGNARIGIQGTPVARAWLTPDGNGGWTLTAEQWRVSGFAGSSLAGLSIAASDPAVTMALHDVVAHTDAFGLNGSDSCDDTVDLNDVCMAGLDLPACEQDCSTPPPLSGEACTVPVKPAHTVYDEATGLTLPVPMPAYPTGSNIGVNADGYVQAGLGGGLGINLNIVYPWACDANGVLFAAPNGVPPDMTPGCFDGVGAPGCAWQY